MLLVLPIILLGNLLLASPSAQNVGYIGPACAVTEDSLFIHGIFVRKLDMAELNAFYKYQGALDVITQLHEALAVGAASVSPSSSFLFGPEVPSFCDGLDGSVEVILNGCIVRKNQVFMAGRIVRPLTLDEKAKIDLLIEAQHKMGLGMVVASQQAMMEARKRRHAQAVQKRKMRRRSRRFSESQQHQHNGTKPSSPDPLLARPQNDFTQLISHFLNINASLAQHFAPMAQSSQLLGRLNDSLIQALRNELRASRRNRRFL